MADTTIPRAKLFVPINKITLICWKWSVVEILFYLHDNALSLDVGRNFVFFDVRGVLSDFWGVTFGRVGMLVNSFFYSS